MKRIVTTVIATGAIAGTLDIAAALINYYAATGKNPAAVLRFIASGIFGGSAFTGNELMPVYGLLFHYFIAALWTLLFFLVYSRMKFLAKNWLLNGFGYGAVVWVFMNQIILPLSNVPRLPFDPGKALLGVVILILCIGLPVSYSAHRLYSTEKK